MDVSGALREAIKLDFHDEFWLQLVDYEQIPLKCKHYHAHSHLIRECLLIKI